MVMETIETIETIRPLRKRGNREHLTGNREKELIIFAYGIDFIFDYHAYVY